MGLNSGATSYHLRQLATYGFIVDDPGRGVGRERWWRAAHAITQWDGEDTEVDGPAEAYLRAVAQTYIERIQHATDSYGTLPQQWQHASTMSDHVLRLTAAESAQLNVARRAQVPLERVTGLLGSIERLASTVGAAGAGAVVAVMGAVPALAVNVVTFVGAVLLIAVTIPRAGPTADDDQDTGSYLARLRDGAVVIRRDLLLRSLYVMVAITNLLDAAMFSVILPVWAHQTGAGPGAVGLLAGALSGAALLASLLAAAIGDRMPRGLTYLVAFLIGGAPRFLVLALDLPISALIGVYLVSGFAVGFLNPIIGAVIYSRIPPPLVGRVTALGSSLAWAGIPFGGLAGGALLAGAGLSPALVILGIAYFVTTNLPALQPAWKQMDHGRRPSSASAFTSTRTSGSKR